jgi:hypothetical protein
MMKLLFLGGDYFFFFFFFFFFTKNSFSFYFPFLFIFLSFSIYLFYLSFSYYLISTQSQHLFTPPNSANINDRSLLGTRDSEIALLIEDQDKISIKMNGKPFQGRTFAHNLRRRLWANHFGIPFDSESLLDPISDDCYTKYWRTQALDNTFLYCTLFETLPNNSITEMVGVRKMMLERQEDRKAGNQAFVRRATSISRDPSFRFVSLLFHHRLYCPVQDPRSTNVICWCCEGVVCQISSDICVMCEKIACQDCLVKLKCHQCQGGVKCRKLSVNADDKRTIESALKNIRGYVCLYPSEFLHEFDLDDTLLSKVVGKIVFQ